MPAPGFGVSFVPDQTNGNDPTQIGPHEKYQQAVRILSLRLPRLQMGGAQIAPAPLLQGAGAQGSPFGMSGVLQTQQQAPAAPILGQPPGAGQDPRLRALLQMSGMGQQQAPMQPRIIPGLEQGTPAPAPPVQQEWQQPNASPIADFGPVVPPRTSYQDQLSQKHDWLSQFGVRGL